MNPFKNKIEELQRLKQYSQKRYTKITPVEVGMFTCKYCGHVYEQDKFWEQLCVCERCHTYYSLPVRNRLESIVDEDSFVEYYGELTTVNTLDFPSYETRLRKLKEKHDLSESVIVGTGAIEGLPVAIGIMDTRFLMGSMGSVAGERITRITELATAKKLPLILFCASGGARMQEGIVSLMQMAKTSAAIKQHSNQKLLYISVLTHPTTGGVTASFASLGDIILAEPKSLIGFAGPRVIENTIKQKLPEGFQRAEYLQEHGFLDGIVPREELREALHELVSLHQVRRG